jgi:hypothetical protein
MARARRTIPSLYMEERAIIRTRESQDADPAASKHYATALDLTSQGLQIYSTVLLPLGEVLDIDISLQGQDRSHTLKGIARSVAHCDDSRGYVISVDLVDNDHATRWRRQFH